MEVVDVAERSERSCAESECAQLGLLLRVGVFGAHLDVVERTGVRSAESDAPPSAVEGGSEHGVGIALRERCDCCRYERGVELGCVHADEERGPPDVRERVRETLGEAVATLGDDIELGGEPRPGRPVECDDVSAGRRRREHVEGVGECGLGEGGGLFGGARRTESCLDPAGLR